MREKTWADVKAKRAYQKVDHWAMEANRMDDLLVLPRKQSMPSWRNASHECGHCKSVLPSAPWSQRNSEKWKCACRPASAWASEVKGAKNNDLPRSRFHCAISHSMDHPDRTCSLHTKGSAIDRPGLGAAHCGVSPWFCNRILHEHVK